MQFSTLYAEYWTRHVRLRLRAPDNVKYFWRAHGPWWENRSISATTSQEVQEWFDYLAASSPSAAVRAVNQLAAIINWGIKRRLITCANPCSNIEKVKLQPRSRFLLPQELAAFKLALAQSPQTVQDFFWLCLLTGARRGNVLSMEWREIDTSLALWQIPSAKHKNGAEHTIPLTPASLAILARRKASCSESPYVFPGKGTTGHLVEPKRAWKTILKRANLSGITIHDLRRTLGSYMAIKGCSLPVIGKTLGHVDQRSTQIYARLHLAPIREALEEAESLFL